MVMDLSYGRDAELFRQEVRHFLADQWQPTSIGKLEMPAYIAAFRRRAIVQGLLYRGVPRRFGGAEQPADVIRAQIIREEFAAARAPAEVVGVGPSMLVPTLIERGADWQRERFIPPTIAGEIAWAQGYSEPGAGSDLASVRTRAELVDGQWIINGHKIWTTFGDRADYMFALVRTEPGAPKHAGLSYLLIDLKQPGVTLRPLRQMTGEYDFSEFFFDDVKTPADWIVGARGEGWSVSRSTLKHERASIGSADRASALFAKLLNLARTTERFGRPAIDNPEIRQRLAMLDGWILAQKYSAFRQFSLAADDQEPGLIALMNKLLATEIGHDVARLALELIGDDALLALAGPTREATRGNEKWLNQIMGSLGVAIAGGTSNIQRNIIAERGLGLPRERDLVERGR